MRFNLIATLFITVYKWLLQIKKINSHRKVTRYAHDRTADSLEPGPEASWSSVQRSSHKGGSQFPEHMADRKETEQEGVEEPRVQACWSCFQDSHLPSWPFSMPWHFWDSVSQWKLPTPHPLPHLSLLSPTKDWNWLSALGLCHSHSSLC